MTYSYIHVLLLGTIFSFPLKRQKCPQKNSKEDFWIRLIIDLQDTYYEIIIELPQTCHSSYLGIMEIITQIHAIISFKRIENFKQVWDTYEYHAYQPLKQCNISCI